MKMPKFKIELNRSQNLFATCEAMSEKEALEKLQRGEVEEESPFAPEISERVVKVTRVEH